MLIFFLYDSTSNDLYPILMYMSFLPLPSNAFMPTWRGGPTIQFHFTTKIDHKLSDPTRFLLLQMLITSLVVTYAF